MKFGQLMKISWEIFFLKNHAQNLVEKRIPEHLWKTKIEHIYEATVWNFIEFISIVCTSQGLLKYIDITKLDTCFV